MPFELHIALRYLLARRKQAFISVISLISTLGVMVGVTALVIALALMTGLQGELRNRILGATAHVYVSKRTGLGDYHQEVRRLKAMPGVIGAAPAILGKALVKKRARRSVHLAQRHRPRHWSRRSLTSAPPWSPAAWRPLPRRCGTRMTSRAS